LDPSQARIATELFYSEGGSLVVREIATILGRHGIAVMPLKGVLLQRLVYKAPAIRAIRDVDILVPRPAFSTARAAIEAAGYSVFGEGGDIFRRPNQILEIDLHHQFSATMRSGLSAADMFLRGRSDTELFGVRVIVPSPLDLYAHLLLHLTLEWINRDRLHHPEDFEKIPESLAITESSLIAHLELVGLDLHAGLMLPMLEAQRPGRFTRKVLDNLSLSPSRRRIVAVARMMCQGSPPGSIGRRLGGLMLAPSWLGAGRDAVLRRIFDRQRSSGAS